MVQQREPVVEPDPRFQGSKTRQGFWGLPHTKWLPDGRHMQLLEPFRYTCAAMRVHTARASLITDGISTPRPTWGGYLGGPPFVGMTRFIALIHDQIRADARSQADDAIEVRDWAMLEQAKKLQDYSDDIFREGMAWSGVNTVRRNVRYYAVRAHAYWWACKWNREMMTAME